MECRNLLVFVNQPSNLAQAGHFGHGLVQKWYTSVCVLHIIIEEHCKCIYIYLGVAYAWPNHGKPTSMLFSDA